MSTWFKKFADDVSKDFAKTLSQPEILIAQGELIKDDKSTTVVRFEWQGQRYILKRFNARSVGHTIKRALRQTRASVCWYMSNAFSSAGVNVAQPIAMLEKRIGFLKGTSYFISANVEGEEILHWLPQQSEHIQYEVQQKIRELFAIFATNQLTHGDMKATNLLWSHQEVVVIDLDVATQHRTSFLFARAHARDKRRFCRNGELFAEMLAISEKNISA